jgi:hypothetical protein
LFGRFSDHYDSKISLVAILVALLVSSFVTGSQLVQPSIAQDLGQTSQRTREGIGQLTVGNQTGNQSTGVLAQLGDQPRSSENTT